MFSAGVPTSRDSTTSSHLIFYYILDLVVIPNVLLMMLKDRTEEKNTNEKKNILTRNICDHNIIHFFVRKFNQISATYAIGNWAMAVLC